MNSNHLIQFSDVNLHPKVFNHFFKFLINFVFCFQSQQILMFHLLFQELVLSSRYCSKKNNCCFYFLLNVEIKYQNIEQLIKYVVLV